MTHQAPPAALRGRRLALVLTTITLLVATGCGSSSADPTPPAGSDRYASAHTGVCTAAGDARAGSPGSAREVFYDTAHQALHELAAAATTTDRRVAARLLEAKETVESAFTATAEPAALTADLDVLVAAVADAITTVTGTRPAPCREPS